MDEIIVTNAAEIMLLWEVGRLQQIHADCFKGLRMTGSRDWGLDGRGWEVGLQLVHGLRVEWSRHAEMLAHHVEEYRHNYDGQVPSELDGLARSLRNVEVDGGSIAGGTAGGHDDTVVHLACLAGLRKAEIAISAADSALSVLAQSPRKWLLDLKVQAEMMLAERLSERMRLEESVRKRLAWCDAVRPGSTLRLTPVCTTRHEVPCAIWRRSVRVARG
ncbi:hypothetical protein E2F46_06585 [Luteimonas aestuarii]|uniref:Uncharacterized protein n=1 Tax=Luteimonas aestuarii TaxID=453837 RepID=A0A4R5TYF0_9GAMM|nr:hypothetical protein [Luteimonas aestuarii]TDK26257.1 hypothetical protein E2F46_06585 [Luteimonas aestuarii]